MEKSVYTSEYRVMLETLRAIREAAEVTQTELAARIGQTQSFVTKCERGERRLDMIQLRTICHALGQSLPSFVDEFERRVRERPAEKRRRAHE